MSRTLTYDDYVHFPSDRRWEVIGGVAYVVPAPNLRHQLVIGRLHVLIANHVDAAGGGTVVVAPFDTVLAPDDVLQPDIVYVSDADADVLKDANIWGSPTWAIEVLSDPYREALKLERYALAKVPEHWLVDPYEDWVDVSTPAGSTPARYTFTERVRPASIPGLAIDLADVLRR